MTVAFKAVDKTELLGVIEALKKSEAKAKTQIGKAAYGVLYYVVENKDLDPLNALVKVLTPANRLAVVQLVQHCTLYLWKVKEKEFKGKNEGETANQAEKDLALQEFLKVYKGDLWDWYENKKAASNETPKFNAASFERMVKIYAANNNDSFEGFDTVIEAAKTKAKNELLSEPLKKAKIDQLVAAGVKPKVAEETAKEMAADGRLLAEYEAKQAKEKAQKAA